MNLKKLVLGTMLVISSLGLYGQAVFPKGWKELEEQPDESQRECSWSSPESEYRFVSHTKDGYVISPARPGQIQAHLPFSVPKEVKGEFDVEPLAIQVVNGWLVSFNRGEFGGELYWMNSEGSRWKKLKDENIVGFAPSKKGILVIVGLWHLTMQYGQVQRATMTESGEWEITKIAELGAEPGAYSVIGLDDVIIATSDKIFRLKDDQLATLVDTPAQMPVLSVATDGETILLTYRHYLVKFVPTEKQYETHWYVPNACQRLLADENIGTCVCAK